MNETPTIIDHINGCTIRLALNPDAWVVVAVEPDGSGHVNLNPAEALAFSAALERAAEQAAGLNREIADRTGLKP